MASRKPLCEEDLSPTARLLALWDHLGIGVAHVATQMPGDIAGLAAGFPSRLGGIVLCVPTRLDPLSFGALGDRLSMISGEGGLTAEVTAHAAARLAGARRVVLAGYEAPGWADVVADRTDEIAREMTGFLGRFSADTPSNASRDGTHAGISYRIEGSGPALVLLPFFLAPSQWAPAVPQLARMFTVITLGGPHLGGVAALEDRARAPTYRAMFRTLIDLMAPAPGETILDVGCGAGSLDRLLARRLGSASAITAIDTNPFLLSEAASLAKAAGLEALLRFAPGNAEALPFADDSFDCLFSITVLEECDADRALAEMVRVAKPGGRVGVIVRSLDLPQWWSVAVPEAIQRKITTPPQSVGAKGVADASLYRRAQAAGLEDLTCFPSLVTLDRPDGPIWRYREDHLLAQLTAEETTIWRAAREAAGRQGLLFMAHPMHCVVGHKPLRRRPKA
jgi:SAM-dependent methyltransferase